MGLAAVFLCAAAAALKLASPRHLRVIAAAESQTRFAPFLLEGSGNAQVTLRCPPGFPARLFHDSDPETSLCGAEVAGSVAELNSWARGVSLAGPPLPTESVVTLDVRFGDAAKTETVILHLATVTAIGVPTVERRVRLVEEGRMHPAATLDVERMPPNAKLTVVPTAAWPRGVSAFFIGRQMYLRPDVWPLPFATAALEFRIKDRRSGLLSRPLALRLEAASPVVATLAAYLLVFGGTLLFLFCALLYVLFAVFRVSRREAAPEEPVSEAVSRWNKGLLSQIKSQQSFASTQAASVELAFRDVTLERISPLELSHATAGSSDLDGLAAIVAEGGGRPAAQ